MRKIAALLSTLGIAALLSTLVASGPAVRRIYATPLPPQYGAGVLDLAVSPSNLTAAPANTDAAGAVTNPSSNLVLNISGGPVACAQGAQEFINPSSMTMLKSTTYLVVWNCNLHALYAKTAVTAPGGQSGTTAPGTPGTFLAANPGEVSLALVVCGTTNCGNTSNGSITEERVAGNFPNGASLPVIAFAGLAAAPTGSVALVSGATLPTAPAICTTGSATAIAFYNGTNWICQ